MKRTPLNRKTPLSRGTKQLKRTRMNPKSKTKPKATADRNERLLVDAFGVSFLESYEWFKRLGPAVPMDEHPMPNACKIMHERFDEIGWKPSAGRCWICNRFDPWEAHHIVSRWDFLGNICMLCVVCHESVQHNDERLPEVLKATWRKNEHLSWVHLVRARGHWWPFDTLD